MNQSNSSNACKYFCIYTRIEKICEEKKFETTVYEYSEVIIVLADIRLAI